MTQHPQDSCDGSNEEHSHRQAVTYPREMRGIVLLEMVSRSSCMLHQMLSGVGRHVRTCSPHSQRSLQIQSQW